MIFSAKAKAVQNPAARAWLVATANFFLLTLIFSVAYTQAPLYTSNQNQYFLHGLAQSGIGFLRQDWLANTLDTTPVFSLLVNLTTRYLHVPALFYGYYSLLMGVYLVSLLGIISTVYDIRHSRARYMVYLAFLVAIHSAAWRFALSRILGINWTYVLEDGVADQRLLGTVLEPSTFAVFLVLSIYLFLRGRPFLAVLCATLAATFHPTYLLSAGVLTLAYMLASIQDSIGNPARGKGQAPASLSNLRRPLFIGLFALLTIAPVLYYIFTNFGNISSADAARAQEILVNFRIPHHALVSWWFDSTAVVKILLVLGGLYLARKSRLFTILLVASLAATGLTVVQLALKSNFLALIFPWRMSIFLVPIATALLLAQGVTVLFERFAQVAARNGKRLIFGSTALILLAMLAGAARFVIDLQRQAQNEDRPVMAYAAANHRPGQVYLTSVKMQDFRLATGSPVYVDFKSIPYQAGDVLEWYRRVNLADQFYKKMDCNLLHTLGQEGVTQVILESGQFSKACPQLLQQYRDTHYGLYDLSLP